MKNPLVVMLQYEIWSRLDLLKLGVAVRWIPYQQSDAPHTGTFRRAIYKLTRLITDMTTARV